jgi:predicted short-subunit dehydrogenase-like oxidoreductase (DUF2520 family)
MGAGLGLALTAQGIEVTHLVRSDRPAPPGAGLSVGEPAWGRAVRAARVVIIATPDAAIQPAAAALAGLGAVEQAHVVLHLSGLHDRSALAPLEPSGAALGSLHPLQAVADPALAERRLRGAYAGVEGDDRAVRTAERLAAAVGMHPVRIPASAKPGYHAAAAIASNLTVALFDTALRVARDAGVPPESVERMYLGLLRGTVENLSGGAAVALTGAIRRGDADTVRQHLASLRPEDARIYRVLGRAALVLAREAGLADAAAREVAAALGEP